MTNSLRVVLSSLSLLLTLISSGPSRLGAQQPAQDLRPSRGQSATLLRTARAVARRREQSRLAAIYDPSTRTTRAVSGVAVTPRVAHRDGHARWDGARGWGIEPSGGFVPNAEQFDRMQREFRALQDVSLTPRARHTATLLSDGRVLPVGGHHSWRHGRRALVSR
jgi:hypothetical protein